MHSTIYQIAERPIQPDEYVGVYNIEAGEMASIFYAREAEKSERAERIKILVGRVLPKGMFAVSPNGETLIYKGGFTEWSRKYAATLLDKANFINETNFKYIGPTYQLQKAIVNPLDTESLFITTFCDCSGTAERSREPDASHRQSANRSKALCRSNL